MGRFIEDERKLSEEIFARNSNLIILNYPGVNEDFFSAESHEAGIIFLDHGASVIRLGWLKGAPYFKHISWGPRLINKLIGREVAKQAGFQTLNQSLAKLITADNEEYFGLISESFEKEGYSYKTAEALIKDVPIRRNSLDLISFFYENNYDLSIVSELMRLMLWDYFICQVDRDYQNFQLELKKDSIRLAPVYDFGETFGETGFYDGSNNIMLGDFTSRKLDEEFEKFPHLFELFKHEAQAFKKMWYGINYEQSWIRL